MKYAGALVSPKDMTAGTTFDASAETIFNRLVEFERGGTTVIPGLAEKWAISPDGLVYTFNLRKGVKFHTTEWFKPSREFNADDALFSFDRMINKDNAFTKAAPASFEYADDMGLQSNIVKIDKPDAMTLRFTLKTADAAFLANLAMSFASIHSAEYADQLLKAGTANDLNTKPVGTGPFVFRRYDKDAQIRYAAFENHWRGKAQIDNLVFSITKDSAVRVQKLKAGECQISSYPKPAEVEVLKKEDTSSYCASVAASSAVASCVAANSTGSVSVVLSGVRLSSFLQLENVMAPIRLNARNHFEMFNVFFIKIKFKN